MKHNTLKTCLLVLLFCFVFVWSACKKDALKIDEEKMYIQTNAPAPTDPLLGTAVSLTLRPEGVAYIVPGGDINWRATYKISGKKLTVDVKDINMKFKFTIISEDELHGEDGEILKRVVYGTLANRK